MQRLRERASARESCRVAGIPGKKTVMTWRQDRQRLYLGSLYSLSALQMLGDKPDHFLSLRLACLKVWFSILGSQNPFRGLQSQNYLYNNTETLFVFSLSCYCMGIAKTMVGTTAGSLEQIQQWHQMVRVVCHNISVSVYLSIYHLSISICIYI